MSTQKPSALITPLRVLWALVIVLFVINTWLVNQEPDSIVQPPDDGEIVERLSWWESFRKGLDLSPAPQAYSVFDGLPIDPDTEEEGLMVMIDNSLFAHEQQYGLRQASLVYEALVEGGITRLMLVFPYQDAIKVGPVRSARDYFVEIAEEYGGIYAHAGGSPTSLEMLWASELLKDMDEDERESGELYSFRDDQYSAPHNLYYDLIATRERVRDLGYEVQEPHKTWCFEDEFIPELSEKISKVGLSYSADGVIDYQVAFDYDADNNHYLRSRYNKGELHIDNADGEAVSPSNLLVQIVPSQLIDGDEKERLEIDLRGEGILHYFWGGKHGKGYWKNTGGETQYFQADGTKLCVPPGQSWISILDNASLLDAEVDRS